MKLDKNQLSYVCKNVLLNYCIFNKLNHFTVMQRCFLLISFDTNTNNRLYLLNIMFSSKKELYVILTLLSKTFGVIGPHCSDILK